MPKPSDKFLVTLISLVLVLVTLAIFWQVRNHEFITLDDEAYVVDNTNINAGFTRRGLVYIFTRIHAGNYHPLTSL